MGPGGGALTLVEGRKKPSTVRGVKNSKSEARARVGDDAGPVETVEDEIRRPPRSRRRDTFETPDRQLSLCISGLPTLVPDESSISSIFNSEVDKTSKLQVVVRTLLSCFPTLSRTTSTAISRRTKHFSVYPL